MLLLLLPLPLQWDAGSTADGIIDASEFYDFYRSVSPAIEGDEYFERMMRAAWGLKAARPDYARDGGGGAPAAAGGLRPILLVTLPDGSMTFETREAGKAGKQARHGGGGGGVGGVVAGVARAAAAERSGSSAVPKSRWGRSPPGSPTGSIRSDASQLERERRQGEREERKQAADLIQASYKGMVGRSGWRKRAPTAAMHMVGGGVRTEDTVGIRRKLRAQREADARVAENERQQGARRRVLRPALASTHGF